MDESIQEIPADELAALKARARALRAQARQQEREQSRAAYLERIAAYEQIVEMLNHDPATNDVSVHGLRVEAAVMYLRGLIKRMKRTVADPEVWS